MNDLSDMTMIFLLRDLRCNERVHHQEPTEAVRESVNFSSILQHLLHKLLTLQPDGTTLKTPAAKHTHTHTSPKPLSQAGHPDLPLLQALSGF